MRKLSIFVLTFILASVSAMAAIPTGFHLDNEIDVTGDWKWDDGWQKGEFLTAKFVMAIDSNEATQAEFQEVGTFGTPWHLDYKSSALVNAPAKFVNELNAQTLNPPTTTPGTDWTKVHFVEATGSEFSQSKLTVNGFGNVYVKSSFKLDAPGGQTVDLNIN